MDGEPKATFRAQSLAICCGSDSMIFEVWQCHPLCFIVVLELRVALIVERTIENTNRAKSGRHGEKKRDMLKNGMPQNKIDILCKKLRERGLWQWDEDWPQDEEDPNYMIRFVYTTIKSCLSVLYIGMCLGGTPPPWGGDLVFPIYERGIHQRGHHHREVGNERGSTGHG